jgi:chromosome segregation ATPase
LENTLRQRDGVIEKNKEALATLSGTLERIKADNSSTADKIELTHKLVTTEKLLASEKENCDRMKTRMDDALKRQSEETTQRGALQHELSKNKKQVEDLQRKIVQLQDAAQKGADAEIHTLTEQRDRNQKIADELKRQVRELQTKLSAVNTTAKTAGVGGVGGKSGGTGSEAEFKHKLEMAERLAKASKDEMEKLKKRFDEAKQQENKLRAELGKLQGELNKAHTEAKAAGLRSPGAKPNR